MKLLLANGTELNPITIVGSPRMVQGANRDVLEFIFSADASITELDALFTEDNCESLMINDVSIHKGYTIRVSVRKEVIETTKSDSENDIVTEERVIVEMAQRTYAETQIKNLVTSQLEQDELIAELFFGGDM